MEHSRTNYLPVPDREPASTGSFDYRPKSVEDWLHNLPVADLGMTSRHVYESLRSSNRRELQANLRLGYLEQLREIVGYITNGLRKQYVGRELPLRSKASCVVTLAIRLLQEMALGYEILIEAARHHSRLGLGHRRRLARALDRAIRYRSRVLLESWTVYQAPPQETWRRLHTLFTIAKQVGLDEQPVRDFELANARRRSTPGQAYRQVVLLAAAGPQRMHHSEIQDAYRLLEHWAAAARLVDAREPAAREALFRVPRALDEPPQPLTIGSAQPQDRLLVTDALLRLIEREFASTRKGAFWRRRPMADIHPELLRRLSLALGAVADRRRQSRMRLKARLQAVLGLTAIHSALSRELGREAEAFEPVHDRFQYHDAQLAQQDESDVWDLIYPAELMAVTLDQQRQTARDAGSESHHDEFLDWSLVNVSAGGYCLVSGPQQNMRARVGELIAMREMTHHGLPWQLGAIRWIRATPEQTLQIGVQLLAPNPAPVRLRAEHADYRFGPLEPGLLLPAVTATGQAATLVAPGRHFAAQRRSRIRYGLRETEVELSRELDATAHYVQFELRGDDALEAQTTARDEFVPAS